MLWIIVGSVLLIVIIVLLILLVNSSNSNSNLREDISILRHGVKTPSLGMTKQTLWPYPKQVQAGSINVLVSPNLTFSYPKSSILDDRVKNFTTNVFANPGESLPGISKATIDVKSRINGSIDIPLIQGSDDGSFEQYTLIVSQNLISITANTVYGASYALATLQQLIQTEAGTYNLTMNKTNRYSIPQSPWRIDDAPRFSYRGILVDSSRNFLPVAVLKEVMDGMFLCKLNVFHWLCIEAQSFPLYLPTIPELALKGAYKNGDERLMYMPSDVAEIVQYAQNRGIRIIGNIEMPTHTFSWSYAYPDIVNCATTTPNSPFSQSSFSLQPPAGQLHPNKPQTYEVVTKVIKGVASLFPDKYIGIGGDEPRFPCWGGCNTSEVAHLLQKFYKNVMGTMNTANKNPLIWQEAVEYFSGTSAQPFWMFNEDEKKWVINNDVMGTVLNKNSALVMTWQGNPMRVLDLGYNIVDTNLYWYLDCGLGNTVTGNNSWCGPYKTWFAMYLHDPYEYWAPWSSPPDPAKAPSQQFYSWPPKETVYIEEKYWPQIKGGEACLWGEVADYSNYLNKMFPRLSAVAERLWSPRFTAGGTSFIKSYDPSAGQAQVNSCFANSRTKDEIKQCLMSQLPIDGSYDVIGSPSSFKPNPYNTDPATKNSTLLMANAGVSPIFSVINRLRRHIRHLRNSNVRSDPIQPAFCDSNEALCDNYCFITGACPCTGGNTPNNASEGDCRDSNLWCPQFEQSNGVPDGTSCECKANPFWGDKFQWGLPK